MLPNDTFPTYFSTQEEFFIIIVGNFASSPANCLSNFVEFEIPIFIADLNSVDIPAHIDGVLGLIIAIFVLISGIKMIKETSDPLIGINPSHEFIQNIISDILSYPCVLGVHDVRCHMYGPTKSFMTIHVEVPAKEDIMKAHDQIDNIERDINEKYGIELTIHMDPIDSNDILTNELKQIVLKVVLI